MDSRVEFFRGGILNRRLEFGYLEGGDKCHVDFAVGETSRFTGKLLLSRRSRDGSQVVCGLERALIDQLGWSAPGFPSRIGRLWARCSTSKDVSTKGRDQQCRKEQQNDV